MIRQRNSRSCRNYFTKSGFTLIELLIVISLVGGLYVVVFSNLTTNKDSDEVTILNQLQGDVRNAFDLAVMTGKAYRFVFDINTTEYYLEKTDNRLTYLTIFTSVWLFVV